MNFTQLGNRLLGFLLGLFSNKGLSRAAGYGLGLPAVFLFTACDTSGECGDSNCSFDEPFEAMLYIKSTINSENPRVPIAVFRGNYDDRVLLFRDTLTSDLHYYWLPVDFRYSVEARYEQAGRTIIAVDDARVTRDSEWECGERCWTLRNGTVNVRIKNYFNSRD
jgi:hypothetical protein